MEIPLIVYGTWFDNIKNAPIMKDFVEIAIELGYNHIDTATNYGTELYTIEGITETNINRQDIFFTSKIALLVNIERMRTNLAGMQYYDLLLLHYPSLNTGSRQKFKQAIKPLWEGMQMYRNNGIVKNIGVSNFYLNHLDLLLEVCDEYNLSYPVVNQIEIHPGNLELAYVPYMKSKNIIPFAHTPLGGLSSKQLLSNEIFINIGRRIGATPAQVVLAYMLKRGIGVVTASKNIDHMGESIRSRDFISILTDDDMKLINATDTNLGPMIYNSNIAWEDNIQLY